MKNNLSIATTDQGVMNPMQEKLKLFFDKGFVIKEIAALTDLPKKLIKLISKGRYMPEENECNRIIQILDETTTRLNVNKVAIFEGNCPEADLDLTDYVRYKLNVTSISIYKGTNDKNMILHIHGINLNDQ